ncbi:hypothetical protein ABFS83_10G004200 [Erythranthe nasuta]
MRHVNHHHHHQQPPPCTVVSVRAKAKRFDFKLKSSRLVIFPFRKLLRFSIRLKIHPYLLEIKSKPESSLLSKTKSLNLKFLNIFNNFRLKRHKNKGIVAHKKYLYGRKGRARCIWLCALLLACFIIIVHHLMHKYYFVLKYIWKACRYAAPYGLLNHFFKVVFDGILQSLKTGYDLYYNV